MRVSRTRTRTPTDLSPPESPSPPPAGVPGQPAWTDADLSRDPHAAADKARRVEAMFAAIARSYDLNNRLHSMWRDQAWRRAAVRMAQVKPTDVVLDVACGTGDLAMAFRAGGARQVVGIDFTVPMLHIAEHKRRASSVSYHAGDAMRLPVADRSVDVVSIAFGIRNVTRPEAAMAEFHRVLRPGGRLIVLEFSEPTFPPLRWFNRVYCGRIMPVTATLIARDRSGAYKYLPRSVSTFLSRESMCQTLKQTGFTDVCTRVLTFGIAVCYRGVKGLAGSAPD